MQLTVLGTGAAIPTGDRYQAGLCLETDATTLLVDCGSGVLHRLVEAGYDPTDVDSILLTHTHLDHVADLPGLAKARYLEDVSEFRVVAPEGTGADLEPLFRIDDLDERLDLRIDGIESGEHTIGGLEFEATRTVHSKPSFAYRFGSAFGFSGDGEATESLVSFFDGVDALVFDCAYPDGETPENHPTPTALASALSAAEPDVDRLYLTHLYPGAAARAAEAKETVAAATDATVRVASDLETIDFDGPG